MDTSHLRPRYHGTLSGAPVHERFEADRPLTPYGELVESCRKVLALPPSIAERQARNKMRSQIAMFSSNAHSRNMRREALQEKRRIDAEEARLQKIEEDRARLPNEASRAVQKQWKSMRGEKLCSAASGGRLLVLQRLIEKDGFSVEGDRFRGETALHHAVRHLQATACMYLLQKGASPNSPGAISFKITPMALVRTHDARDEDHEDHESWCVVKSVLNKISLWKAAQRGDHHMIRFLIRDCQQQVNQRNRNGMTALHFAAANGDIKTVHLLLRECHADPNSTNKVGQTPADLAQLAHRDMHQLQLHKQQEEFLKKQLELRAASHNYGQVNKAELLEKEKKRQEKEKRNAVRQRRLSRRLSDAAEADHSSDEEEDEDEDQRTHVIGKFQQCIKSLEHAVADKEYQEMESGNAKHRRDAPGPGKLWSEKDASQHIEAMELVVTSLCSHPHLVRESMDALCLHYGEDWEVERCARALMEYYRAHYMQRLAKAQKHEARQVRAAERRLQARGREEGERSKADQKWAEEMDRLGDWDVKEQRRAGRMASAVKRGDIGAMRAILQGTEPVSYARPQAARRLQNQAARHNQSLALAGGASALDIVATEADASNTPTKYQVLRGVREAEAGGFAEMRALLALELGREEQEETRGRGETETRRPSDDRGQPRQRRRRRQRDFTHGGKMRTCEGRGGGGVGGNTYAAVLARQIQAEALSSSSTSHSSRSQPVSESQTQRLRHSQSQDSQKLSGASRAHPRARARGRAEVANARNAAYDDAPQPLRRYVGGVVGQSRSNAELLGRSTSLYRDPGCV